MLAGQLQRQVAFKKLSVDEGLSQNSIVSISQDTTGYMWFATQDGLNQFDGKTFTYYPKFFEDITQDTYSKLGKVYAAPNGSIYIITQGQKLELYNAQTEKFDALNIIPNPSSVYQDDLSNLWIGSYGNGLVRISEKEKDTLHVFKTLDIMPNIYSISQMGNRIYAASSSGLHEISLDGSTNARITSTKEPTTQISALATTLTDTVWAGSYGKGLFFYTPSDPHLTHFNGFDPDNTLPTNLNIQALLMDNQNRLWLATYGNGAYRIDFKQKIIQHFEVHALNPRSISYNDVLSLYLDHSGMIWLGTDGGGLNYYDENLYKFNEITNATMGAASNVDVARAIAVDQSENIWIGTSGKGLTKYNPNENTATVFSTEEKNAYTLPSNRIMSLYADGNDMWVGFQNAGLSFIDSNAVVSYDSSSIPALSAKTIWCFHKDTAGRFWLGSRENGIIQFDRQQGVISQFTIGNSQIGSNNIRSIIQGPGETLFIGTEDKGLFKFNPNTKEFTAFSYEGINNIKALHFQAPMLWIGTNGNGLYGINQETGVQYNYTTTNGLPNNVIYGILPGKKKELWLSSNRGLTILDPSTSFDFPDIKNYDSNDGLQSMEFNTGAHYKDQKGLLYFGGLKGINWFAPSKLESNLVPPETVIDKIELFADDISPSNNRTFKATDNTLSFTFASLHFSEPESNQYQYILEGYEENWSKPNTINYAHFPKLPPGDYSFKVISSNYEGVWDTTPASYRFTIKRPWYRSIVAMIVYVTLLTLLLWSIYRYLKWRWNIQMELQMEHDEADRLRQLDELKSKLYTNISHEFRTPLTLISAPIKQLLGSSEVSNKGRKSLQIIENSSERMLRLVNQLLDLSKLEKGAVELRVGNHPLKPQLIQLLEAFTLKANEDGITIQTRIDDFGEVWYDKDVLEKITSNLLSNAVKYSPENSVISFSAIEQQGTLVLKTTNYNTKLSESEISKLFNRFFQADKDANGIGVGLALIKELAILSNGSAKALKETKDTITFVVELPTTLENYNANSVVKEVNKYPSIHIKSPVQEIFESTSEEISKILVVEDNAEIRAYLTSLFSENYELIAAADGLEGMRIAIAQIPDLIISDIMMPKKDGVELCNTLKLDKRTSHIPIILLTAKSGDHSELEGLKNKADDYIVKPFNPDILHQKVTNLIASRRALRERYSQHVFLKPKDIAISSPDELFLENVQLVLDEFIDNPEFNAEKFASSMQMSRMQLHRKIKALTALSTTEFIRSQRLKSALKLLSNSGLTVNEIAFSVGFNTPSYFIKCFKETYGVTPSEYEK